MVVAPYIYTYIHMARIMENHGKSIYKWMIWGYHYFRKPPYIEESLGPQEWSVAQPELISKGLDV